MSVLTPPRKRAGQASGRRRLDGEVLDVATVAVLLGTSEKCVRARIARGLLPHRRFGGRIVVLADELEIFLAALPGISAEKALRNVAARNGQGPTP